MVNKRKCKNPYEMASSSKKLAEDHEITNDSASQYTSMPPEILLHIFKFMSLREMCRVARVCKAWRQSCRDETFWSHIDLSGCVLDTSQLWKLARQSLFSSNVKSLKLGGNLITNHLNRKNIALTKALLNKLTESCLFLEELNIEYYDLNSVEASHFSANLCALTVKRCEISQRWFQLCNFKRLQTIDLSGTSRVNAVHISDLLPYCKKTLESMKLTDCYRVNDKAIEVLILYKYLKRLDLQGTDIAQYGLQLIVSKMVDSLEYLNIKNCRNITKGDVNTAKIALVSRNIKVEAD